MDRTVLHLYSQEAKDPTPTPTPRPTREPEPSFTEADVIRLAQRAVSSELFPIGTNAVRCVSASFRSGNRMWVVSCEFSLNPDFPPPLCETFGQPCPINPKFLRTYLFNDATGELTE